MVDVFWYYMATLSFICVVGALLCVYRYYLGNKLLDQSSKLKSQMANIRKNFPELEEKKSKMVANALGDIGISGILDELGIDSGILKNPLVKGLIDKYAPRVLEQLTKQGGKGGTGEETSGLL